VNSRYSYEEDDMAVSLLTADYSKKEKLGLNLLNACYFGNVRLAVRLLENPECPAGWMDPRDGWSSIHYAARWGKIKILESLLRAGVDVNLRTTGKETALHKACRSNRLNVCVWLIEHGADPELLNGSGERASFLTAIDEVKFVCDHFREWKEHHAKGRLQLKQQ